MATKTVVVQEDPEVAAAHYLHDTDDNILECRGQGHDFPKIRRRSGNVPKGISVRPQADGCYQVTFTCPHCKTVRTLTTLPGGQFDYPAKYAYKHPPGYKAPKGSGLTRRDCFMETWRRVLEANTMLALPSANGTHEVPQVEFRNGD